MSAQGAPRKNRRERPECKAIGTPAARHINWVGEEAKTQFRRSRGQGAQRRPEPTPPFAAIGSRSRFFEVPNCLRLLGQLGLTGEIAPIHHPAKRRRIRTVLQENMYPAAKFVVDAGVPVGCSCLGRQNALTGLSTNPLWPDDNDLNPCRSRPTQCKSDFSPTAWVSG